MSTGRVPGGNVAEAHDAGIEQPGGRALLLEDLEEQGAAALISAVELLGLRGEGPDPFTVSPANDPIAFLLDAMADAVSVARGASVLYRNRAAEQLLASGRSLERRSLRFRHGDSDYTLEIIHQKS